VPQPTILLTRRWPAQVESYLAARYEITLNERDMPLDPQALQDALRSFDAVCPTVTDQFTVQVLQAGATRCRILGNYGVGVSHIDLAACREAGIVVTNTPDVLTESTADLAVLLMLMVARRAGEGERQVRAGAWPGWSPTHHLAADVSGKTLGVLGFGRIGQATARKAQRGFCMRILYHSRRRVSPAVEAVTGAVHCATPEELLGQADFVSLHCPGGAETRHLLDAARLGLMRRSAFLINTARGEIILEDALVDALRTGRIAGAGLDVYEHEPRVPAGLADLPNVVLLPHLGSATLETRVAMGMRVAENLDRFFAGLEPHDRVA